MIQLLKIYIEAWIYRYISNEYTPFVNIKLWKHTKFKLSNGGGGVGGRVLEILRWLQKKTLNGH